MTNREIALAWEQVYEMAQRILRGYYFGENLLQARKDQKSLEVWLNLVKMDNLVYNGRYDYLLKLKL